MAFFLVRTNFFLFSDKRAAGPHANPAGPGGAAERLGAAATRRTRDPATSWHAAHAAPRPDDGASGNTLPTEHIYVVNLALIPTAFLWALCAHK